MGPAYSETGYVWDRLHNRDKLKLAKAAGLTHRGGGCRICGKATDVLVLDHDHVTGLTRAFICQPCNTKVGFAEGAKGRKSYLRLHPKFATTHHHYLEATEWTGEARVLGRGKKKREKVAYTGLRGIG